jgi:SAM-dependent methyltransferase
MNGHDACPHCGVEMSPIKTPPDSSWGGEVHRVCFNDDCCYFVESWDSFGRQGIEKTGYRCRMDPRGTCGPAPVWSKDALKDQVLPTDVEEESSLYHFDKADLARDDETPDSEFYSKPRFVDHLDTKALSTVEHLYGRLIQEEASILDLMTGPDSHLEKVRNPKHVVGLGLNEEELGVNALLSERIMHDLNADPRVPLADDTFDAVINTVSVDYLTRPLEVFRDVARVLKAGGIFVVVFSNRMFPPKAVNIWKNATERQRVDLVRRYFTLSGKLRIEGYFESVGKPRPKDDKYYDLGIPSDPIFAVWGKALKHEHLV